MPYETLRAPADPLVMFHGTSSGHLESILAEGLLARPPEKSSLVLGNGLYAHLVAFDGTYLSLDPDRAQRYAEGSVRAFGGEPLVVTAQVVPSLALPDEDEVLWVIKCQFHLVCEERDYEPGFAGLFRDPGFRRSFARDTVPKIRNAFMPDRFDPEAAEAHLLTLLEGVALLPADWESVTGSEGWLAQPWALRLAETPEGLARYRSALDGLCRALPGARATDETCGMDGYKLRVPDGIPLVGPSFVAAVGPPDDPTRHLDRIAETDAGANPFAARFLGLGGPGPR